MPEEAPKEKPKPKKVKPIAQSKRPQSKAASIPDSKEVQSRSNRPVGEVEEDSGHKDLSKLAGVSAFEFKLFGSDRYIPKDLMLFSFIGSLLAVLALNALMWFNSSPVDEDSLSLLDWKSWFSPIDINTEARLETLPGFDVYDLWFEPEGLVGYAAGTSGMLLESLDGGLSWTRINTDTATTLTSVTRVEDGTLFFGGANLLYRIERGSDGSWQMPEDMLAVLDAPNSLTEVQQVQQVQQVQSQLQELSNSSAPLVDGNFTVFDLYPGPDAPDGFIRFDQLESAKIDVMLVTSAGLFAVYTDEAGVGINRFQSNLSSFDRELLSVIGDSKVSRGEIEVSLLNGSYNQEVDGAFSHGRFLGADGIEYNLYGHQRSGFVTREVGEDGELRFRSLNDFGNARLFGVSNDGRQLQFWDFYRESFELNAELNESVFSSALTANGVLLGGTSGRMYWAMKPIREPSQMTEFDMLPASANAVEASAGVPLTLPPLINLLILAALVAWFPSIRQRWRQLVDQRLKPEVVRKDESVEQIFISDRPLEEGDPDALDFDFHVQTLFDYIRNTGTKPPLTIGITGPWGSGKTSFMNLLKAKLRGFGIFPVWFNAWHHQQEEDIFAALLENIRAQAIPPIWSYSGIVYRRNLLIKRVKQRPWSFSLSLVVLFSAISFALGAGEELPAVMTMVSNTLAGEQDAWSEFAKIAPVLLVNLGAIGGPLLIILNYLKSFGVDPSTLLMASRDNAKRRDLNAQTSFRRRFAEEFAEVSESLGDYPLALFIDDLDRCSPKAVLTILESINFLAASGRCYIILGMDEARVLDCVTAYFKGSLGDEVEQPQDNSDLENDEGEPAFAPSQARAFAKHYMEKLVQVRVAVPMADSSTTTSEFVKTVRDETPALLQVVQQFDWKLRLLGAITCMALVGAALFWAHQLGEITSLSVSARGDENTSSLEEPPLPDAKEPSADGGLLGENEIEEKKPTEKLDLGINFASGAPDDSIVEGGQEPFRALGTTPIVFAIIGAGVFLNLLRKPDFDEEVTDSKEFTDAVADHGQLLYRPGITPRRMKGFLNSVRYHAMLVRVGKVREQKEFETVSENLLVQIGALQTRLGEDCLGDTEAFEKALAKDEHATPEEISRMWSMYRDIAKVDPKALKRILHAATLS